MKPPKIVFFISIFLSYLVSPAISQFVPDEVAKLTTACKRINLADRDMGKLINDNPHNHFGQEILPKIHCQIKNIKEQMALLLTPYSFQPTNLLKLTTPLQELESLVSQFATADTQLQKYDNRYTPPHRLICPGQIGVVRTYIEEARQNISPIIKSLTIINTETDNFLKQINRYMQNKEDTQLIKRTYLAEISEIFCPFIDKELAQTPDETLLRGKELAFALFSYQIRSANGYDRLVKILENNNSSIVHTASLTRNKLIEWGNFFYQKMQNNRLDTDWRNKVLQQYGYGFFDDFS